MNDNGALRRAMIAPYLQEGYTRGQANQLAVQEVRSLGLSNRYEVRAFVNAREMRSRQAVAKRAAVGEDLSTYGRRPMTLLELRGETRRRKNFKKALTRSRGAR